MKNILISGYYGMNNTGDDALLAVTSWGGKRFLKADKIIVTAVQVPLFNGSHFIYASEIKMPSEFILCRDSFEVDELIMRIREIIAGRASSPSLSLKVAETLAMRNWIWEGSSYREDDQAAIF